MTTSDELERRLSVLLDEYKELCSDIRLRIDLQQRNGNVLIVLITALTGYLASYSKDHGLYHAPHSLVHSEIAVLIAIAPLFASVFVWRHLDHDANIIDKAMYIDTSLRPEVVKAVGGHASVLEWEAFQRRRRNRRPFWLGPLVLLGNEHIPMLLLGGAYLTAAWYIRLDSSVYAGQAHELFNILLYAGSALFAASLYMSVIAAFGYRQIGERPTPKHAPPKP